MRQAALTPSRAVLARLSLSQASMRANKSDRNRPNVRTSCVSWETVPVAYKRMKYPHDGTQKHKQRLT